MAADLHLDPDRLRVHARRADVLAELLGERRAPGRGRNDVGDDVDGLLTTVRRVACGLSQLADDLRAAAAAAEEGDRSLRATVRRIDEGWGPA